jgi:hypothetical protein
MIGRGQYMGRMAGQPPTDESAHFIRSPGAAETQEKAGTLFDEASLS